MTLHQVRPQALFGLRFHLVEYLAGISVVEVAYPTTKAGIHILHYVAQGYWCEPSIRLLLDTFLDFRKRFGCRADMRIAFARPPTLAHPDFKSQESKTLSPCINNACLALIQREIKSIQHSPYRGKGRVNFAPAQHHKIIRIPDDSRLQFHAALLPDPDPIKQMQVAVRQQRRYHTTLWGCLLYTSRCV